MCGISGVRRYGNEPITEEVISLLLTGNEHRGGDAAGMAIQQADGAIDVFKRDVMAWKFTTLDDYKKFIGEKLRPDSLAVILHARAASQGNPRDNNNNHPMYAGKCAVIHNGVIRNDHELFNSMRLDRKAETDSDIIRAIIDEHGFTEPGIKALNKIQGSGAGAIFHPEYPGKMLLFRSGNPMCIASNENFFVFSSEKNTIHRACRPWVQRFGLWFQKSKPDMDFSIMADDTAWILGPEGFEKHFEFNIMKGWSYQEPVRMVYDKFAERQEDFDRRTNKKTGQVTVIKPESKKKFAWCEKCKLEYTIPINDDPSKYKCWNSKEKKGCNGLLIDMPKTARRVN